MRRTTKFIVLLIAMALVAAACGGKPKPDVSIFIMFPQNSPFQKEQEINEALQARVGEAHKVHVNVSPLFDLTKMTVELVGNDRGIYVLPEEQFNTMKNQDGYVPLDDVFDKEQFPGGVYNGQLVGVPLKDSKLLQDLGYKGSELYAFMIVRAANKDKAKEVLKVMAER